VHPQAAGEQAAGTQKPQLGLGRAWPLALGVGVHRRHSLRWDYLARRSTNRSTPRPRISRYLVTTRNNAGSALPMPVVRGRRHPAVRRTQMADDLHRPLRRAPRRVDVVVCVLCQADHTRLSLPGRTMEPLPGLARLVLEVRLGIIVTLKSTAPFWDVRAFTRLGSWCCRG
jgi:hypothetical protein